MIFGSKDIVVFNQNGTIKTPTRSLNNSYSGENYFSFGSNNLFPYELAYLNRTTPTQQGILSNKVDLFVGNGYTTKDNKTTELIKSINNKNEPLDLVARNWAIDFTGIGNGALIIVTNRDKQFVNIFHTDITNVRAVKDKKGVATGEYIIKDFQISNTFSKEEDFIIPSFPNFDKVANTDKNNLYSIYFSKDYTPNFPIYGLPDWSSILDSATIQQLTNNWNKERIANGFALDGIYEQTFKSPEQLKQTQQLFADAKKDIGKQGNIFLMPRGLGMQEGKFTQIKGHKEGEWSQLHIQAQSDIFIAHKWRKSLIGADEGGKLNTSSDTILRDWEYVMGSYVLDLQNRFKSIIKDIYATLLNFDFDYEVINNEPVSMADVTGYAYTGIKKWQVLDKLGIKYDLEKDPTLLEDYTGEKKEVTNGL